MDIIRQTPQAAERIQDLPEAGAEKRLRQRQATHHAFVFSAVALLLTFVPQVLAQTTPTAGGTNDPTQIIKQGICGKGLLGFVTNPLFVGVALAIGVAIWGWSQYFGQRDSTVALKQGFIGMVAVLCCATIAGFFVAGC